MGLYLGNSDRGRGGPAEPGEVDPTASIAASIAGIEPEMLTSETG